ncbi:37349_t:CDS:2, partial [Gigaspora margarita]
SGYHTVLLDLEYLNEFEKLGFTSQKSLLSYILEDELYEELMGIRLVPLFENGFGQFGKNYYITSSEQFELFPKSGPNHLFLLKLIPNQKWLNKIWGYILNDSLELYESFPLLEIYNPSNPNQHKLDIDIVRILTNLGIRFTKHHYTKKLEKYILNLEPYNILSIIQKYQCKEKLVNNNEAKESLCQYFCKNLILHNENKITMLEQLPHNEYDVQMEDYMPMEEIEYNMAIVEYLPYSEYDISILKQLHIWPTHNIESEDIVCKSILDSNTYLVPTPFKFPPLNKRRAYYYNLKYPNMQKLLEFLNAKKRSKFNYIKDVISDITSIPQQMQNEYLQFLIDIFSDNENLDEIKNYIEDLKIIPNKTFELYRARDLFDQNVELFLKIGFKSYIIPGIFVECAKDIQTNFELYQNDSSKLEKIPKSADMAVNYFYKNQSKLKFSKDKLDKLSEIKFIPTSKKFLKSYPHSYEGGELQSFENLCHSKYKSLAWTQLSIFYDDPNPDVLINYSSLVSKSDKWREIDNNGEKLFKTIKDIYEELLKRLDNNPDEFTFYFPKDDPLFLNSINLFDSKSWVIASDLVLNIQMISIQPKKQLIHIF